MTNPNSLVHRTYTSFVSETPVPETNKPNTPQEKKKQSNVKAQLQEALDILPDSKTHWETTIEHLNNVSNSFKIKLSFLSRFGTLQEIRQRQSHQER